jgi:isopenicillin-N N-acyltransferase-like protein
MGRALGAQFREHIHEIYATRLARLVEHCAEGGVEMDEAGALAAAAECLPAVRDYNPDAIEELVGIAAAAGMDLPQVWLLGAYTDLRDYCRFGKESAARPKDGATSPPSDSGAECSGFFAGADATADGNVLIGQTWDLGTEDMEHVIACHRKPADAPECWTITVTGALPMIGMNECGISCCTNNLEPGDVRPGVGYLDILSSILRCDNLSDATDAVISAPRISGHNYLLADGTGLAVDIETTGRRHAAFPLTRGVFVHTNHYVDPELAPLERVASPSSVPRRLRMHTLLQSRLGKIDAESVKAIYSDRTGEFHINRYDCDGMSTNACLIMSPVQRRMWMCRAQADRGEWLDVEIA